MKKERVELSVHTKMSRMDAVASAGDYVRAAAEQGQPAIAVTDHGCVQAFPEAMRAAEQCKKEGRSIKILYGMEAYCADSGDAPPYHVTILVQNEAGLKNLYQLITQSHLHHFRGVPLVTGADLQQHRRGLLVGSGCGNGKLFSAAARGEKRLSAIARAYDFLEIQPVWNCKVVVPEAGKIQEELRRINRIIVQLGDDLKIPVCATGNVHYLKPEDEQARRILRCSGHGSLYLRSTREMLRDFAYLGKEKAREVVIDNTNLLAERTEELRPIATEPTWARPEDEQLLLDRCLSKADEYDGLLTDLITARLAQESAVVKKQKSASSYRIAAALAHDLCGKCGVPVMTRRSAGASLLAYFSGISRINPLPPHYHCRHCGYTELPACSVESGFDLPGKTCPSCGERMARDGQNIPWQDFGGQDGEKLPDFDFNIPGEFFAQGRMMGVFAELFGENRVVRAGATATVSEKIARYYIREYEEKQCNSFPEEVRARIVECLTGVRCGVRQYPGGYVLLPGEIESESSLPLQYAMDDPGREICTHFNFYDLTNAWLKMDCLGYDASDLLARLCRETGCEVSCIDLHDRAVYDSLLAKPSTTAATDSMFSCAVELVLNGLTDRELRSSLPRNFTGIRKAICHLQNGSVSENAPGYHKAYAVELAMAAVELGWYKLRFPEEFESACRCTYKNFERKALMQ